MELVNDVEFRGVTSMIASRALPINLRVIGYLMLVLLLLGMTALPTQAATTLPPVNNFATAQLKMQATVSIGGLKGVSYGAGAVVMPDRTSLWLATDESPELTEIVQIGGTVYMREGDKPWEITNETPLSPDIFRPISAQLNELQESANSVTFMGDALVGDVPTKHYQLWISPEKLFDQVDDIGLPLGDDVLALLNNSIIKYDFWIGANDGFLHQQLNTIILPASSFEGIEIPEITIETLVTYFDINNPNLSVNAPI